ncbi:MAG: GGDEF domain-containing protein [Candidatus Hydrothermales bacterium]
MIDELLKENVYLVITFFLGILIILLIIIFDLKGKIRDKNKTLSELERRLKSSRETHEFMVKELTNRIDELNLMFSKRKRIIQSVINLARALSELREEKEIVYLVLEQTKNILNVENVYYFTPTEDGLKYVLFEHKTSTAKEPLKKGDLVYNLGEGPIGYVAKKRYIMDKDTMFQDALVDGIAEHFLADPFGIDYEIISPLTYHATNFGVIAVSGVKEEKVEGIFVKETKEEALRTAMEALQMISELTALSLNSAMLLEKIQTMADTDGLTGIYNKRYFMERLEKELIKAKKEGYKVGIFMLDIDFFKKYNDTNGHPMGDKLLKGIATILKRTAELVNGIPARYGGEEFIVILPKKDKFESLTFGDQVRKIIEKTKFPKEEKQPGGKITISGGVAVFPDDADNVKDLIEKADKALYKAKESGKNRVLAAG